MKKLFVIVLMVFACVSANAQNYFIGVGLDKGWIVYPDEVGKANCEFLVCGQYENFDGMLSFGLFDNKKNLDAFSMGFYGGYKFGWFTLGGHLGYEIFEARYKTARVQSDDIVLGAYAKVSFGRFLQVFTFYKVAYSNNSNIKWDDRGFGFGVVIGFSPAKKSHRAIMDDTRSVLYYY